MNRSTVIALALATVAGSAKAGTSWGPVPTTPSTVTRQEVMAQTQEAIKTGNIIAVGELGGTVRPQTSQAAPSAVAEIRAEARKMGAAMERREFVAASHDTTHLY